MTDADSWTDIQHMSLPLFLLHSDNKVGETGGLCVGKVDVIACDFRKERPFSERVRRAIRLPLIPVVGGVGPTQTRSISISLSLYILILHNDVDSCARVVFLMYKNVCVPLPPLFLHYSQTAGPLVPLELGRRARALCLATS